MLPNHTLLSNCRWFGASQLPSGPCCAAHSCTGAGHCTGIGCCCCCCLRLLLGSRPACNQQQALEATPTQPIAVRWNHAMLRRTKGHHTWCCWRLWPPLCVERLAPPADCTHAIPPPPCNWYTPPHLIVASTPLQLLVTGIPSHLRMHQPQPVWPTAASTHKQADTVNGTGWGGSVHPSPCHTNAPKHHSTQIHPPKPWTATEGTCKGSWITP
jgi:hypothetical protein